MKITRKQLAYEHIRERLLAGSLGPGDRLSPQALGQEMGISHIPVREAIGQLQSDGVVVQIPHRGAFVRQPDRREIEELIDLRGVLECNAAEEAARRIGDVELDHLESLVKVMGDLAREIPASDSEERSARLSRWTAMDMAFHPVLLHAAGNRQVVKVIEDAMMRIFGYFPHYSQELLDLPEFFAGNFEVHRGVYLALRRRDPKASRRAMTAHMRRARKNILVRFEWYCEEHGIGSRAVDDPVEVERRLIGKIKQDYVKDPAAHANALHVGKRGRRR